MLDEGSEKLDINLDVVKIIKSLKKLKILMENSFLTDEVKKQIKHSEKNILILSSDENEDKIKIPFIELKNSIKLSMTID